MKNVFYSLLLLLLPALSHSEQLEPGTFVGSLSTREYMVEVWNQESAPIYIIRNKAEGPATDKRNTKMLAKTYPDLADLVNASTENDASLGPAIKEHPRKKRKF